MSTLSLRKIKHDSSAVDNIVTNSDGGVGIGGIDPSTLPGFIDHAIKVQNGGGLGIQSANATDNRWIFFGNGTANLDVQRAGIVNQGSDQSLALATGGTQRLIVDAAGRVTMPYQTYFHVHNLSGFSSQSFSGDGTVLQFLQTAINRGNGWNSSTYRFTAPISGSYFVYAQARFDGITSYSRLYIAKNGSTDVWNPGIHNISPVPTSSNWSYWSHSVSGILYLNSGDYIEARGGASNSSGNHQGESSFGAYLVG